MCIPWKRKPKKNTTATSPPRVSHVGGPSLGVFPCNPVPPDVAQGSATTCEKKKTGVVEPGWKPPPSSPPHLNTDTDSAKLKKPPPSQPPQPNSDSDGAKSKQSKKTSAPDQKHASPDTTIAASPPPKPNSDVPSPESIGVLNQPPPSPEKNKMGATEPLQNYHHRNLTTYQDEGNTRKKEEFKHPPLPSSLETEMMRSTESLANNKNEHENSNKTQQTTDWYPWTSSPEEQTTKSREQSSNDKKNRNSTGDKWSSEEDISNHTIFSNF